MPKAPTKAFVALVTDIGNQLRIRRKKLGISQRRLAGKTGIDRANIAKYEKGQENPTIDLLLRLARAIDADLVVTFAPKPKKTDEVRSKGLP